jgi:AcrR family transcriptional regulator
VPAPHDNAPIWAQPEPGSRRPRFSREQIAAAALAIADTDGFDAVSMRRVATALGAGTMTLYHYVRTKDDLVALMDDTLMAASLVPDGEMPTGWRAALMTVSHRTRMAIGQHPWALVSLRDARMGPNAMRHFEQSLQALRSVDLGYATKIEILAILDDYVHGHLLRADEVRTRTDATVEDEEVDAAMEFGMAQLATGEFPLTRAMWEESERGGGMAHVFGEHATERRFDTGLQIMLDGLAIRFNLPDQGSQPG